MHTAETVWKLDQVINELRQAIAKLELAKGEVVAGHYRAMADEAAAQNARPRTEPAEASEVKVGESIVTEAGRVRRVVTVGIEEGFVMLRFAPDDQHIGDFNYYEPNALLDVVVDTKLADEAANRAGLARTWAALKATGDPNPEMTIAFVGEDAAFEQAQAEHLVQGLIDIGRGPAA